MPLRRKDPNPPDEELVMMPCPACALSVRELEGPGEWVWPEPVTGVIPDVGVVPKSLPLPVPREDLGVPLCRKERNVSEVFFKNELPTELPIFARLRALKHHHNTPPATSNTETPEPTAIPTIVATGIPVPRRTHHDFLCHCP